MSELYSLAAFFDYGSSDSRNDLDGVAGYGLGVRWRTPVGPISGLAYGSAVERWRLHFSIGYNF
ncbi:MAG: BamA/TamA family outer membrane protein [Burkholderiaceae bacterium]